MNAPFELAPPVAIQGYYELRLHETMPGRMAEFRHLMEAGALPAFRRAGLPRPLARWEGHAGPVSPLCGSLIAWPSLDGRMEAWRRLDRDPEWIGARKGQVRRSHVFILRPSPAWNGPGPTESRFPAAGIHELSFHDVLNQDPGLAHRTLAETDLPFLRERGARILGVFATWFGTRINQAVTLLAWPDSGTMRAAHRAHRSDPAIQAVRDGERRMHGRPLLRGSDIHLLTPIP